MAHEPSLPLTLHPNPGTSRGPQLSFPGADLNRAWAAGQVFFPLLPSQPYRSEAIRWRRPIFPIQIPRTQPETLKPSGTPTPKVKPSVRSRTQPPGPDSCRFFLSLLITSISLCDHLLSYKKKIKSQFLGPTLSSSHCPPPPSSLPVLSSQCSSSRWVQPACSTGPQAVGPGGPRGQAAELSLLCCLL